MFLERGGASAAALVCLTRMAKRVELSPEGLEAQRYGMVESQLRARGLYDERVLAAMARVPRHEFVAEVFWDQAYEDHPVPIGEGQTVSQPYIVAIMLQAAALQTSDKVLEVGTGSGYQTALLAELAAEVYSLERHYSLAENARNTLRRLGYLDGPPLFENRERSARPDGQEIPPIENYDGWGGRGRVHLSVGDGSQGWPENAPFDVIIVSAAAPRIPRSLFEQLKEGGRMAIPVGPAHAQELQRMVKREGNPVISVVEGCRFVPLIGSEGYSPDW